MREESGIIADLEKIRPNAGFIGTAFLFIVQAGSSIISVLGDPVIYLCTDAAGWSPGGFII